MRCSWPESCLVEYLAPPRQLNCRSTIRASAGETPAFPAQVAAPTANRISAVPLARPLLGGAFA
jgi:hypothetical protein